MPRPATGNGLMHRLKVKNLIEELGDKAIGMDFPRLPTSRLT